MNEPKHQPVVDVIIPVYRNLAETRRCLESLLAATCRAPHELVVVDDRGDEPELAAWLDGLAASGAITLVRNPANLGFVASVNRGMALHPDRDMVLLNSDTRVNGDWLDRLQACALAQPGIGTVTPFSNNATICSYPVFCADNELPAGLTLAELDGLFRQANRGQSLNLPTAVGFCMYIRRACLDQVGRFDEAAFPRGYGEENDFSRRARKAGWRNVLCADTFVWHTGSVSFGAEREGLLASSAATLARLHPDYAGEVAAFVRADPVAPLRRSVDLARAVERRGEAGGVASPVLLHVVHQLGGGIARWCDDFCQADRHRRNLVLMPYTWGDEMAQGLMLREGGTQGRVLGLWPLEAPIGATVEAHPAYRRCLEAILRDHQVGAVLVSSLLGHALDCLDTGLPTLVVLHDYYPYCPAINLHHGGVCQDCDATRLEHCLGHNQDFNPPFPGFGLVQRLAVRARYLALLQSPRLTLVAPSQAALDHLGRLAPALARVNALVLPHGHLLAREPAIQAAAPGLKLRIVVLGMLSVSKGVRLLREALPRLLEVAEVHLVGTGELGDDFRGRPGLHVVPHYRVEDLPEILTGIRPDLGLLLSIWPETFSYTLSELHLLGVPVLATRLGAFAERIRHAETGWLVDPEAEALLHQVEALQADRAELARVRAHLADLPRRTPADMVADYHRLLPLASDAVPLPAAQAPQPSPADLAAVENQVRLWQRVKGLRLRLDLRDLRVWELTTGQEALQAVNRDLEARLATLQAAHQALAADRARLEAQLVEHVRALAGRRKEAQRLTQQLALLRIQYDAVDTQVNAMFASTSWRVSYPLRWLGSRFKGGQQLLRSLAPVRRDPAMLPDVARGVLAAWRAGGLLRVKHTLLNLPAVEALSLAWREYQGKLQAATPALVKHIQNMARRPRISVLMPTYNTPVDLLTQAVDSVRAQIYPEWELCIADDGSPDARVRDTLHRLAAQEPRIRLHLSADNQGVSQATNLALALATGEFVVLLDHDDLLEPQALYRVAEAWLADQPDLLYSDEVVVSGPRQNIEQFALRPGFSLEYLRAHPYIVHLVGFRTGLLRELGGLDPSLRISQDYDLILRAAERARVIAHIPEVLYRWRLREGSAGHEKQAQVMATSMGILRRHLERCGETASVEEGPGFNFFRIRYPLAKGSRVAIVIPTKNHVQLLRQCVDTLRATIRVAAYDLIIIDHDSDDPVTLAYLDGLGETATVLRYSGEFNFSVINNWAIARLPADRYSHYLLCNNDIEALEPGWLERMLELAQKPDVGIVGAKLYYPDGETIQHAGVCVGAHGAAEHYAKRFRIKEERMKLAFGGRLAVTHEMSAVTAACLLIRKDAFDAVQGFDESIAVGFGDVDLCLRVLEQGYRILFCPEAELKHHESFTRGASVVDPHPEDTAIFLARWRSFLLAGDPYFNPGYSVNSVTWEVKLPITFDPLGRRRLYEKQDSGHFRLRLSSP